MTELDVEFQLANPPWSPSLEGEHHNLLPLNSTSGALGNSLVVKAGAGKLYGFQGYSNRGTAQFIQVFDVIGVPSNGAVPVIVIPVGAGAGATTGIFSGYFGSIGRSFQAGIVLCNSSTLATLTIGSADTWFDVQYA